METLISPSAATEIITQSFTQAKTETITLADAISAPNRVLAQHILADRDAPPFDRVMMDGICINTFNQKLGSWRYRIIGTQAAGTERMTLPQGEFAIEVMTGAPLPKDANAVIPIEKIDIIDGYALPHDDLEVHDLQLIHHQGSDSKQGDIVLKKNTILNAAELATAASVGATALPVYKLPKIHLITTGDEVIPPDQSPADFQIRRSHPAAIKALINSSNLGKTTDQHIKDNPEEIEAAIKQALHNTEILILTGGISMGKFDWVAPLLKTCLGKPAFHGVSQRPGKPFAFWRSSHTTPPVFALPGNPVSVMATMHRYVLPALAQMQGIVSYNKLPLAKDFAWEIALTGILPYRQIDGKISIQLPQNSGDYLAAVGADGFVEIAPKSLNKAGQLLETF